MCIRDSHNPAYTDEGRVWERYVEYLHNQVKELCTCLLYTSGVHRACDMYKDQILSYQERNGDFNEDLAYDITKEIFSAGGETPTGIFAANDLMAIGAVNALKDIDVYKRQICTFFIS